MVESEGEPDEAAFVPPRAPEPVEPSDDELFEHAMQGVEPLEWNEAPARP